MPCNICKLVIFQNGLQCTVCDNFELCILCYKKDGHCHSMKRILLLPSEAESDQFANDTMQNYVPIPKQVCKDAVLTRVMKQIHYVITKQDSVNLQLNSSWISGLINFHTTNCSIPDCQIYQCPFVKDYATKALFIGNTFEQFTKELIDKESKVQKKPKESSSNMMLARKFTAQRCIRTLVHASQCIEPNCMPVSCKKMKRILAHIKNCQRKLKGSCNICLQLTTLCCYHAKDCKEKKCPVPLCSSIKKRIMEKRKLEAAA